MGFSIDLFVAEVDDNLTCPICHDVLENPESLSCCGHTFCKSCLDDYSDARCPTCRRQDDGGSALAATSTNGGQPATSRRHPAYCLQGLIDNLQICCRNNDAAEPHSDGESESESVGDSKEGSAREVPRCEWVGKLSSWPHHARNECCVSTQSCDVEGCGFLGNASAMEAHNRSCTNQHLKLMLASEMKRAEGALLSDLEGKLREQISSFQRELRDQRTYFENLIAQERETVVHMYLASFCRSWMQSKPKFLADFEVYHETKGDSMRIQRLLCMVPGPKGSRWKNCRFPFMLEWAGVHRPPTCRLPPELRHYFTSRTLPMYHFTKSDRWEPDVGIPELLHSIQQFLGRADVLAQMEALHRHHHPAVALLHKYRRGNFLANAEAAFDLHTRDWQRVGSDKGGNGSGDAGSSSAWPADATASSGVLARRFASLELGHPTQWM